MVRIKIPYTKIKAHAIFRKWKKDNHLIYNEIMSLGCSCGNLKELELHHEDGDKTNNELNNLQCLCHKCHFKIHAKFQVRYKAKPKDYPDLRLIPNFIFRYLPRCGIKVTIIDPIPKANEYYW